jgi:hypothetical protein
MQKRTFQENITIPMLYAALKADEKDLKMMHKSTLRILINSLYAMCGYTFKDEKLNTFFNNFIFYIPYQNFSEAKMPTNIKERIELIKSLEVM